MEVVVGDEDASRTLAEADASRFRKARADASSHTESEHRFRVSPAQLPCRVLRLDLLPTATKSSLSPRALPVTVRRLAHETTHLSALATTGAGCSPSNTPSST
ncbi:unnamed protein product [Peniophora sp. CBMAI 1063]|nr:unnamed protein product [Peniophora sp. CBMAI 1063]